MASTQTLPRGIRAKNPGNIEKGQPWQGLADDQSSDKRFAVFTDPTWGIRALARILISYQDKYDIRTIDKIIARWAPAFENETAAYAAAVSKQSGLGRTQILDMQNHDHIKPVLEAIIRHECGQGPLKTPNTWYGDDVIEAALTRAGIVKKAATVAAVPVTRETVSATGIGAVGIAQLADVAPQVMAAMEKSQDNLSSGSWVRIVLGVLTIALAAYVAWSQVKKHKVGVVQ